eukprot:jgi/Mesvir1/7526/Mv19275-RA.2
MRRPDFGTKGTVLNVRVNYFLFERFPAFTIHQYDVEFKPEMKSNPRRCLLVRQLEAQHRSQLGALLPYDGGKIIYTVRPLPGLTPAGFTIRYVEEGEDAARGRDYAIVLKPSKDAESGKDKVYHSHEIEEYVAGRQLDMPTALLQGLDVVLSQMARRAYVVGARGNFFHPSFGQQVDLTGGLETCKGQFQSVRFTQKGLALNVDTVTTAMIKRVPLIEYAAVTCLGLRGGPQQLVQQNLDRKQHAIVSRMIKNLRALAVVGGARKYRMGGLTKTKPADEKFECPKDSGNFTNVQEYYATQYGYKLKYPQLPCVMVGTEKRRTLVPMEALTLAPGQRAVTKLNRDQVTNMLRAACQAPAARFRDIENIARKMDLRADPYAQSLHLQIQGKMMEARARVLGPPKLCYGNKTLTPPPGQWNMNGLKVLQGASVRCWALLSLADPSRCPPEACDYLLRNLAAAAELIGMKMGPPVLKLPGDIRHAENALRQIVTQARQKLQATKDVLQLVVVLLPGQVPEYPAIKLVGNHELGVATQCLDVSKHVSKSGGALEQVMVNVSLKINVKLGGRNVALSPLAGTKPSPQEFTYGALLAEEPTIIFGADVTHPTGRELGIPSIAAVVANVDWPAAGIYKEETRSQVKREEMIQEMEAMASNRLKAFEDRNGCQPRRIIFYRDGVSEGQFNTALLHDVKAVFAAWKACKWGGYPRVTYIVVQKRHHMRMAPIPPDQGCKPAGNLPPGTVVDQDVASPVMFDFWLQPHIGIQGTCRAARYCVLYDDNHFTADRIQGLTHALCYTYVRCTRSVSVVPAVYYADEVAYKARDQIKEQEPSDTESVASSASGRGGPVPPLPLCHPNLRGDIMVFA